MRLRWLELRVYHPGKSFWTTKTARKARTTCTMTRSTARRIVTFPDLNLDYRDNLYENDDAGDVLVVKVELANIIVTVENMIVINGVNACGRLASTEQHLLSGDKDVVHYRIAIERINEIEHWILFKTVVTADEVVLDFLDYVVKVKDEIMNYIDAVKCRIDISAGGFYPVEPKIDVNAVYAIEHMIGIIVGNVLEQQIASNGLGAVQKVDLECQISSVKKSNFVITFRHTFISKSVKKSNFFSHFHY